MPRVLDLFCGAGGAGMGYHLAGFEVVGVDIEDQPEYPFPGLQGDALKILDDAAFVSQFDLIHASPPCQAYLSITPVKSKHVRLMWPVRDALSALALPYVIENPAARHELRLCGEMFGLGVIRHRWFEFGNWPWHIEQPAHVKHRGPVRGWRHGKYVDGPYVAAYGNGGGKASVEEMQQAMGMSWVTKRLGLVEAIPPAYTEYIGRQFREAKGV